MRSGGVDLFSLTACPVDSDFAALRAAFFAASAPFFGASAADSSKPRNDAVSARERTLNRFIGFRPFKPISQPKSTLHQNVRGCRADKRCYGPSSVRKGE